MVDCNYAHDFTREHVPWDMVNFSQADRWRHKCAACAYERGFNEGLEEATNRIAEMFRQMVADEISELHID